MVESAPLPQRRFADVTVGDRLVGASYVLPVHRLVLAAGSTRDYTATHHNDDVARAAGAPSMFASAILLQGMWERALRDYIGLDGTIRVLRDFRMARFTPAGSVVRVDGRVVAKESDVGLGLVHIEMRTSVDDDVTVGPGLAVVTLP